MAAFSSVPSVVKALRHELNSLSGAPTRFGYLRLLILLLTLALGTFLYWVPHFLLLRAIGLFLIAAAVTFLLIASHEACHGTLLGLPALEFVFSLLIGWPMAWPSSSYRLLHLRHHSWNSIDPRDPERVQPLPGTFDSLCWKARHPLWWHVFVLGGIGLIVHTFHASFVLRSTDFRLSRCLFVDLAGIAVTQALFLALATYLHCLPQYLFSWIVVERLAGGFLQLRALIEHWGLAANCPHPILTQLYASSTIHVPNWVNFFMGGLPYHSVHHAFPAIPASALPAATRRVEALIASHQLRPLPTYPSYWAAIRTLA